MVRKQFSDLHLLFLICVFSVYFYFMAVLQEFNSRYLIGFLQYKMNLTKSIQLVIFHKTRCEFSFIHYNYKCIMASSRINLQAKNLEMDFFEKFDVCRFIK